MPIYDYECEKCGHRFDLRQHFDAEPVGTCPNCAGRTRRRFHSVAVIYKGSGFYTTDYKNNGYSPPGEEKSEKKAPPVPKAKDTKAEDKTATTSEKDKG